jgi:hypothetical protein
MGKGTAAGIVIALIVGVLVGYLVLPMLFPVQANSNRQTNFVTQNLDNVNESPSPVWTLVPKLNISFSTSSGDTLVLLYTCDFIFDPPDSQARLQTLLFKFRIDAVRVPDTQQLVIQVVSNSTIALITSITYRLVKTGISAGAHNVSVNFDFSGFSVNTYACLNVLSLQIL